MPENTVQQEKSNEQIKQELIMSDEFENALLKAADVKNVNITSCKSKNKDNYMMFYDIMVGSDREIRSILDTPSKHRNDEDNNKVKAFKKNVSQSYKNICETIIESTVDTEGDDGDEQTKLQKNIARICSMVKMMKYIGHSEIEDEFKKYGVELKFDELEKDNETFAQPHIKEQITDIFEHGTSIGKELTEHKNTIKVDIFEGSVPLELQYDKESNPTGIKNTDFCKLVELKAKMESAKNDDEKQEKVKDKAENMAGDYVFQNRRNEIIERKLMELAS